MTTVPHLLLWWTLARTSDGPVGSWSYLCILSTAAVVVVVLWYGPLSAFALDGLYPTVQLRVIPLERDGTLATVGRIVTGEDRAGEGCDDMTEVADATKVKVSGGVISFGEDVSFC